MNRRVANFYKKLLGLWRIILINSAIITIIIVKLFASFQTFIFVLVPLLFVVPLILFLTSGIFADIKFFVKRFENLPEDDRPTGLGSNVGISPLWTFSVASAEIVKAHEKAAKLKRTKKRTYFHKMKGRLKR